MFLNLENIASDVKLSSVFFGINFATTLYGFKLLIVYSLKIAYLFSVLFLHLLHPDF